MSNPLESVSLVHEHLNKALKSGRWMIAVWEVSEDKLNLHRVMVDFPLGDLRAALNLLQEDLRRVQASQIIPESPLDLAPFVRPTDPLYRGGDEKEPVILDISPKHSMEGETPIPLAEASLQDSLPMLDGEVE